MFKISGKPKRTWILQDSSKALNIAAMQNPMSIIDMALLFILLTVAHMGLRLNYCSQHGENTGIITDP